MNKLLREKKNMKNWYQVNYTYFIGIHELTKNREVEECFSITEGEVNRRTPKRLILKNGWVFDIKDKNRFRNFFETEKEAREYVLMRLQKDQKKLSSSLMKIQKEHKSEIDRLDVVIAKYNNDLQRI